MNIKDTINKLKDLAKVTSEKTKDMLKFMPIKREDRDGKKIFQFEKNREDNSK